jgi:hypothetical protein
MPSSSQRRLPPAVGRQEILQHLPGFCNIVRPGGPLFGVSEPRNAELQRIRPRSESRTRKAWQAPEAALRSSKIPQHLRAIPLDKPKNLADGPRRRDAMAGIVAMFRQNATLTENSATSTRKSGTTLPSIVANYSLDEDIHPRIEPAPEMLMCLLA